MNALLKIKTIVILNTVLVLTHNLHGQVITVIPSLPTDLDSTTIIFDATQGNKGLMNYTGDVYAHTGVITDKSTSSSDWRNVKSNWGVNIPECKLSRIDANHYALKIKPSIRAYYAVLANEKILKMAFVFRSALPYTGNTYYEGKEAANADIFADVYEAKLNVAFTQPFGSFSFFNSGQKIPIEVNAVYNDSIQLFLNGKLIKHTFSQQLLDTIEVNSHQLSTLIAKAWSGSQMVYDSTSFLIRNTVLEESLPPSIHDGINYIDSSSVTFVLFAPHKSGVYLIGDFNNWLPDSLYQMKKDGDRFWVTISGLTPRHEYACQYLVDETLRIADPYSEKILDPWNDKSIPSRIYPSLMKYPEGKTTEIAGVIEPGQPPFNWEIENFIPAPKNKLVIYELLIRDFTANGDIKTITDTLAYFKKLGINAIELMPISEFEGNEGWGYNPSFYFAPEKIYGTKTDYKTFIDACHKNGIAVIQDMVLNHSYGQSPLVRLYFDGTKPTTENPWYNVISPNPVYSWGFDFNHESLATQAFVDRVTSWWLTEYKIDGFRFDFSKGFTNKPGDGWAYDSTRIRILKRMSDAIWAVNPNSLIILEHFTDNTEEKTLSDYGMMLWGRLNDPYDQASMGYNTGGESNFSAISYISRGWTHPNLVGYMESHDEERMMFKNLQYGNSSGSYTIQDPETALKRVEMSSSLFLTVPGPKMLWEFEELGYDVSINYNNDRLGRKPIHWDYYDDPLRKRLFDIISKLILLKESESVFSTQNYSINFSGPIKTMTLNGTTDTVIIVGNFDVNSSSAQLNFPFTGTWYDYFYGDSLDIQNTSYSKYLEAGEYHIYSSSKLTGFGSFNVGIQEKSMKAHALVYPNPACDNVVISSISKIRWAGMYDLTGRCLLEAKPNQFKIELNTGGIPSGTYFVHFITSEGKTGTSQIIIVR